MNDPFLIDRIHKHSTRFHTYDNFNKVLKELEFKTISVCDTLDYLSGLETDQQWENFLCDFLNNIYTHNRSFWAINYSYVQNYIDILYPYY